MECSLFHTTALINDYSQARALVDPGSAAYALISKKLATRLHLPLLQVPSRRLQGAQGISNEEGVSHVTSFSLDIGAHKNGRAFAYVVPNLTEDLILGRPWTRQEGATIDEKVSRLVFPDGTSVLSDEGMEDESHPTIKNFRVVQVMSSTYAGLARRSKRPNSNIEVFAASLADIEKALRTKPVLSLAEVITRLPEHYRKYASAFDPREAAKLPPHRPGIDHEIPLELNDDGRQKEVPWGPLYSMSRDELLVLRKELTRLLDSDFIRASKSPAAAPVLFAKKPGGGLRFCVDYRGLNAITRKDRYPLPLIRETLAALNKAKWLTKLDVSAAFHRVRVAKGDEWKTAFRTRYGLFEWKVCPFGLTGSPATFQRFLNWVLRDYLDDFCSAYVDDILIFTTGDLKDHRAKVSRVLQRLLDHDLTLDLNKCEFETKATKYLGYIVEVGAGIRMDPEKVKAILDWQRPTTVKAVRSFLGFANYYRLFIDSYTDTVKPLTDLTKRDTPFEWTQERQKAFDTLKESFTHAPVLATYDPDRETRLEPDSSGWASGGVLTQRDTTLQAWRPVAFFSAKHAPAECNYDIHDKELLAIIKCVKEWSSELRGLSKPFTILTDHKNLEPFMTKRLLNERQVRWAELLAPYSFRLQHRPGRHATIPDALSRREQDVPKDIDDTRFAERQRTLLPKALWVNTTDIHLPCPFTDDNDLQRLWAEALKIEEVEKAYREARDAIRQGARHFPKHLDLKIATGECDVKNDLPHYRERIWMPRHEPLTTGVIQKIHDSFLGGHPGRDATIDLLARQFYWPGMNQDVRRFLRNCDVCGRTTIWRDKKKGMLKPLPVPSRIWQEISMDFITDLPPAEDSRATILLVITDRLSKGTILLPIHPGQFDAEHVAHLFIERYVPYHWIPKSIVSDRGSQFVNGLWSRICELLRVNHRLSTAYHPETDGSTERRNQEVETYLRTFVAYEQSDWTKWLPLAQIALDNKVASTTGVSPFFLSHGYNAETITTRPTPSAEERVRTPKEKGEAIISKLREAQDFAQSAMAAAQQMQEHYANRKRDPPWSFKKGDKVWLSLKNIKTVRASKKLDWLHAKYTITKVYEKSPHFYELDVPPGIHNKFHVSLLRPAATDGLPSQMRDDSQPPALAIEDGEPWFGVETILRCRTRRIGRGGRREALVKWTGFVAPTWEPLVNVDQTDALRAFEARYGDAKSNDGPPSGGGR